MPELPERKAGIVACSGEEIAEGTVTRLAALEVLHGLRRGQTVTICLPLFLAGGEGERSFARTHPTITVDGCALRCAAIGTERHSGKPAASIVVSELLEQQGLAKPSGRRCLDGAGRAAVTATAQRLAQLVDEVLGRPAGASADAGAAPPASTAEAAPVTCSCGSGIPVRKLEIAGRMVEVVALPVVMRQFRDAGKPADEAAARELLAAMKVYNPVAPEDEGAWLEALLREYRAFRQEGP